MKQAEDIQALKDNKIIVLDNFISAKLCNEILFRVDSDIWEESRLGKLDENNQYRQYLSDRRTNKVIHFHNCGADLRKIIASIENKIVMKTRMIAGNFEYWQLSKYGFREKFDFHNDCGCWAQDPSGEREKTILLYLMTPTKGGETFFRALNLFVRPQQGRLVIWDNLLPDGGCNYGMIHGGLPVKEGIKITLNTWVRKKRYRK